MTYEVGTLKELNVQPGDVVVLLSWDNGDDFIVGHKLTVEDGVLRGEHSALAIREYAATFRIVSRAKQPVDLTAINVPFGMLDEVYGKGTTDDFHKHGGPYQVWTGMGWTDAGSPSTASHLTYRVKSEPKIVEITSYHDIKIGDDSIPVKLNYNRVDGVIDHSTVKVSRGYV